MLLQRDQSQLLMIDMQEKLVPAMHEREALTRNCLTLLHAAGHLDVPITISEQYPQGLGHTLQELKQAAGNVAGMAKMEFSCARDAAISTRLNENARRQIVLCGVEAHVCVLQTALDLRASGMDVFVVLDAVASRREFSSRLAADRLTACGVHVVSVEMVIFEWARAADEPAFKLLRKLIL
jgi:nicotinamidase-related amidase